MALFSEEQLKQFQTLLKPLDARLSDIDKQQGDLWETSVRQSVREQYGHSFSKEFTIASLQHLAKIICRSVGWPFGSDAVDICRVSEQLASRLLEHRAAENLLRSVFEALVNPTDGKSELFELGEQIKEDPWFDTAGNLDKAALGRSLSAFDDEDRKHVKSKLQKVHRLATHCVEGHKGADLGDFMQCTCFCVWARLIQSVCSGQVSHLLTCRSAGVMLALYAAEPTKYSMQRSTLFKDFTRSSNLPFLQLQMDVRGKITMINNKVTIEVGEIKRNLKQYREAKHQLLQRAKLLQWAMDAVVDRSLEFVLIGHLSVPRGKPDDNIPDNEIEDAVSIFFHQL